MDICMLLWIIYYLSDQVFQKLQSFKIQAK
jgi:hypothetical protein